MADSRRDDPADALAAMMRGDAGGQELDEQSATRTEDDLLAAPPPDASVFAPKRSTRDLIAERRMHQRRTLIPILLTCGLLMPLVGSLRWAMGEDSPFAAWPLWAPVVLWLCGVLLLALAAANMMQVKQMMRKAARR